MFSKTGSMNRKKGFIGPIVLALAAAALAPTPAAAHPQDGQSGQKDIPYLSRGVGITRPAPVQANGGVTPTNLARSYEAPVLGVSRSEEHTSELQSRENIVCRLL